ncbi:hypothetical protein [Aquibacillus rhizosphaerae]|uniref:SCP2 domain-containing protein n=1 Tax=Aquibacillus rhizosphaerae TaxID=3051431 RepID=A0ABT7L3I4_9BACI|nr:hypothetical protein [Aquibacillus sp. LR5S19]MDL4839929.1 hypothetical protein [Aquibacillus sp. LR5S19]
MDTAFLLGWKDTLESRSDLLCLHKNKKVDIHFVYNNNDFLISFNHGVIELNQSINHDPDLSIETTNQIIDELISGKTKLTSVPNELARITGKYKDVLFFEAILYLSSS